MGNVQPGNLVVIKGVPGNGTDAGAPTSWHAHKTQQCESGFCDTLHDACLQHECARCSAGIGAALPAGCYTLDNQLADCSCGADACCVVPKWETPS